MAGFCPTARFTTKACVVRGGLLLEVPIPPPSPWSHADGINERGDVVGAANIERDGFDEARGFIFDAGGRLTWLGGDAGGFATSTDINDTGMVVGDDTRDAVFWERADRMVRLPPVVDNNLRSSVALALNNQGLIVGGQTPRGTDPFFDRRLGVLWDPPRREGLSLGTLGFASIARDINDRGQIVGTSTVTHGGESHAVMWTLQTALHITTPNNSSRWGLGTTQRLAWTYEGDAPQLQIEISRDGGALWDSLAVVPKRSGGSQNFYWTVTGPATTNARLRVTAIGEETATDVNDANIRIAPATIEFVLPYRKSVVRLGTEFRVFWKHNLGARVPVAVDVSADGGTSWRTLAESKTKGSTTSSFRWVVDLLPTNRAQLRVRALDASGATGVSELFAVSGAIETLAVSGGTIRTNYIHDSIYWDVQAPNRLRFSGKTDRGGVSGWFLFPRCAAPSCEPAGTPGLLYRWDGREVAFRCCFDGPLAIRGRDDLSGATQMMRITSAPFALPPVLSRIEVPFTFEALVAVHERLDFPSLSLKLTGRGTAVLTNNTILEDDAPPHGQDFAVELIFATP